MDATPHLEVVVLLGVLLRKRALLGLIVREGVLLGVPLVAGALLGVLLPVLRSGRGAD